MAVERRPVLMLDFDDVIVDMVPHMQLQLEKDHPGEFTQKQYDRGRPDPITELAFHEARQAYLRRTEMIHEVPFCPGVVDAVHIFSLFFGKIHINTGRWTFQRMDIEKKLEERGIGRPYIEEILSRPEGENNQWAAKQVSAYLWNAEFAVEDYGPFAKNYASERVFTALIERPWNKHIANGPYLRRYHSPLDFALEILRLGSARRLIPYHQSQLATLIDPCLTFSLSQSLSNRTRSNEEIGFEAGVT